MKYESHSQGLDECRALYINEQNFVPFMQLQHRLVLGWPHLWTWIHPGLAHVWWGNYQQYTTNVPNPPGLLSHFRASACSQVLSMIHMIA